jgi:hypothetical protein
VEQEISENKGFFQHEATAGNAGKCRLSVLGVLQVVGSNPAAPTKNTVDSLTFFPRDSDVILTRGSYAVPSSPPARDCWRTLAPLAIFLVQRSFLVGVGQAARDIGELGAGLLGFGRAAGAGIHALDVSGNAGDLGDLAERDGDSFASAGLADLRAQQALSKPLDLRCHVGRPAYPVNRVATFENPDCVIRPRAFYVPYSAEWFVTRNALYPYLRSKHVPRRFPCSLCGRSDEAAA